MDSKEKDFGKKLASAFNFNLEDDLMKGHGLKKPQYEANQAFVEVTFYGPGEQIFDIVKASNETDLRELGLNERQIKALQVIQEKNGLDRKQYEKLLAVSKMTALRDLKGLTEKGLLQVRGKGPAAEYFLK